MHSFVIQGECAFPYHFGRMVLALDVMVRRLDANRGLEGEREIRVLSDLFDDVFPFHDDPIGRVFRHIFDFFVWDELKVFVASGFESAGIALDEVAFTMHMELFAAGWALVADIMHPIAPLPFGVPFKVVLLLVFVVVMAEFGPEFVFDLFWGETHDVLFAEHLIDSDFASTAFPVVMREDWGDKALSIESREIDRHFAVLDEFAHTFDEVLIHACYGGKSFWRHRDDAFLLDDRKDGFDAEDIDAEILLWEDAHPLEGPLEVASEELAIPGDHVEWARIHDGLDV